MQGGVALLLRLLRRDEEVGLADHDEHRAAEARQRVGAIVAVTNCLERLDQLLVRAVEHLPAGSFDRALGGVLQQELRALVLPQSLGAAVVDERSRVGPPRPAFRGVGIDAGADQREGSDPFGLAMRHRERRVPAQRGADERELALRLGEHGGRVPSTVRPRP